MMEGKEPGARLEAGIQGGKAEGQMGKQGSGRRRSVSLGQVQQEKTGLLSPSSPPLPGVPVKFKTLAWKPPFQGIFLSRARCRPAQRQSSEQDMQGTKAPIGQGQGRPFWKDPPCPPLPSPRLQEQGMPVPPRYSLDTCRRILLDRAVPNLLRAKHWYSPS